MRKDTRPTRGTEPKPTRGMPRSLIYAMIPAGFLVIILILMFSGFWTQEETHTPTTVVPEPPAQTEQPVQTAPPAPTQ